MRDYAHVYGCLIQDLSCYPTGPLTSDFSPKAAAAESLRVGLYKKLAPRGQTPEAVSKTIEKFERLNSGIKFDRPQHSDGESMSCLLDYFRSNLVGLLDYRIDGCNFDLAYMRDHFAMGPGASRGCDSRNFYTKFWESDHSYTEPHVLALFRASVSSSDTWTDALLHWGRSFRPVAVEGNSLFTVPKNSEISRTCCTEPLINMLMQKALGSFIEERLLEWGLDLARQPDINRELTRIGSVDQSFGTIDLSDASDSIAWSLCEWAFEGTSLLGYLRAFRSSRTRLPDGRVIDLAMVSTMGNGFTFPLETAIFASAVRAVYQLKGIPPRLGSCDHSNAGVFGDDIIVREDCYNATIALLHRLGFRVNASKSFNSGSFRESCGFDYWAGVNIRPVYIVSLETPQDVYSSFNRLARWSAQNGIPIVRTLLALRKMAPYRPIPFSEADDSGFKVPFSCVTTKPDKFGWYQYKLLVPVPPSLPIPETAEQASQLDYLDFNPYGWELAFLGGYARTPDSTFKLSYTIDTCSRVRASIMRRPFQGEVLPRRVRSRSIPYWDWFGLNGEDRFFRSSFQRWETLVDAVMTSF